MTTAGRPARRASANRDDPPDGRIREDAGMRADEPARRDDRVRRRSGPGVTTGRPGDWRSDLLAAVMWQPPVGPPVNRLGWPGYDGRAALRWGEGTVAGVPVVVAAWDFAVYGGSFGERDAAGFAAAARRAATVRRPLVSFLRSGGTRLQEGVAGLVGLPRATLARRALDAAGVAHLAVVDQPTTGGVWMTVGSRADLRAAVDGATVGFAGPRVVAAMTGAPPPPGSHTAAAAYAAGLVDAVLRPEEVEGWLRRALRPLSAPGRAAGSGQPSRNGDGPHPYADAAAGAAVGTRSGWAQVQAARTADRPSAGEVLRALLPAGVDLSSPERTVQARVGELPDTGGAAGGPAVAVAVAADRATAPGPDGYRLLSRAAELAGKLGLPLVTLVDTPGADPGPGAEAAGIAAAVGAAMAAVLECPSPTISVVVGEGGSGGALAAACTDVVLMTPDSYVTALSPEGAAATLRIPVERAADAGGLRPTDLFRLGFTDAVLPSGGIPGVIGAVGAAVGELTVRDQSSRLSARNRKWSTGLQDRL
jgi:acetyl-CoA carboxylase carboxyl transferase subunit beta